MRDSAIYGGGGVFLKLIAFFTFPLLAAALSTAGFGLLELAMTVVSLGGILVRCGLNNAVQRFYWDQAVISAERSLLVSTGFFATLLFGIFFGVVAFLFLPSVFPLMNSGDVKMGLLGLLAIALLLSLTQWAQYIQDVLRLHFAPWSFLGFSFTSRALGAILSVAAVVYLGAGVEGVLFVQALVLILAVPFGVWLIRKDIVVKADAVWLLRLINYGAPFIFTELAYWLFSSIDRWMLASMAGVDDVGLYSVAFRFSSLALFVATAFGMAWSPYAVKIRTDYPLDYRKIYAQVLLIVLVVMLSVAGVIALFSGELLGLFLPPEYSGAATPLAILCFTTVLQASQQVTAIGISLAGRTRVFAYLVWMAALLNIGTNWLLIPSLGVVGAAWATVLAYFLLSSGFLYFTQRYYPLPIAWGRLLWICLLGSLVLVVSLVFQRNVVEFDVVFVKLAVGVFCLLLSLPALNLNVFRSLQDVKGVVDK